MAALMKIEGFRSLNADIETIINKSESVKKAKEKGEKLTPKEKKEISDEEKEFKSKRKEIQEKLIKFATRIPVFMYLTDYREQCLKDVITQLEPGLFRRVTGLGVKDFELLVSLGLFNDSVMNDAVYKFRRYEDASLSYTGIERHKYDENVGLFDTALSKLDYEQMRLQDSLLTPQGLARKPGEQVVVVSETVDAAEAERAGDGEPARPRVRKAVEVVQLPKPEPEASPERVPERVAPTKEQLAALGAGSVVVHKAFGRGEVVEVEGGHINVHFGDRERRFQFPNAFEQGFLGL